MGDLFAPTQHFFSLVVLTQIPCVLIFTIAYGSHWFVFRHHMAHSQQVRYQLFVGAVWVSYAAAVFKLPGAPPKNYLPDSSLWKQYCQKCRGFKPPRTHHCKSCNQCVLLMDHHCPWTLNCVGHGNLPHFLRFLGWVVFTTGYTGVQLTLRTIQFYQDRNLPAYLMRKSELIAVIVLLPVDIFVCLTVLLLLVRCLANVVTGTTQIESWEKERMETQARSLRFWDSVKNNYRLRHGQEMPELHSWTRPGSPMTADDIVFPYDLGFYRNTVNALGLPWTWLLPWGKPATDGIHFEIVTDDQLDLPWPPDGGYKGTSEPHVYRDGWVNEMGETPEDYGVVG